MTSPRLFRSAGIVSLGTLSSRLLGLIREMMMAWAFGTSLAGSAFFVAFTIPNLFRRLFGEGALSAAFIPTYVRVRDNESQEAAWSLTRNVASLLLITLGGLTLLLMIAAGFLMDVPALPERVRAVLPTLRIMLPYTICICLAALVMGVLNSHRKYVVSAFTPCLLNLVWIAALIGVNHAPHLSPEEKSLWLAWAILLAGGLQFLVQLPSLRKLGYRRSAPVRLDDPKIRRILLLMGPAALGAAVTQINVLLDRFIALWVADYGPSALSFSERLIYLPLGLFATALGTILLPEMSGLAREQNAGRLSQIIDQSLRGLSFLMLPAAIGLGLLATPIVELVYARGAFDAESVLMTSRALAFYAPGLVIFSLAKVFVPVFYAHHDTRTPVRIGMFAVIGNLSLNLLFIVILPEGWKHAGLALGTVASEAGQVTCLAWLTHRRHARLNLRPLFIAFGKQGLACIPLIATVLLLPTRLPQWGNALTLFTTIGVAALLYLLSARLLRCRELHEFRHH
jgi:putative peptidoglycan lipid II flippase